MEIPVSDRSLVSVIIPTHNRAGIVDRAIKSAIAQTYPHKEILVVDDGSTDKTEAIVSEIPGVIFHRKAQGGPASARNLGLNHANGSIIALLDSDDAWDAEHLTDAVAALEATGAGFVCANFRGQCGDGTLTYRSYYEECRPHLPSYLTDQRQNWFLVDNRRSRELFLRHSEAPSSATVLRRSVIGRGWDDRLFGTEDHMILVQAIMDYGCAAAFSLRPTWTKHTGTGNIYDGSDALARHARMNVLTRRIIRERWGDQLTARERRDLRTLDAGDYADWAYYESKRGQKLRAFGRYLQSVLSDRSVLMRRLRRE